MVALVLAGAWFSYLMAGTTTFGNKGFGVVVAPFAAVFALIAARWLAGMKREGWAFIAHRAGDRAHRGEPVHRALPERDDLEHGLGQ